MVALVRALCHHCSMNNLQDQVSAHISKQAEADAAKAASSLEDARLELTRIVFPEALLNATSIEKIGANYRLFTPDGEVFVRYFCDDYSFYPRFYSRNPSFFLTRWAWALDSAEAAAALAGLS